MKLDIRGAIPVCMVLLIGLSHVQGRAQVTQVAPSPQSLTYYRALSCANLRELPVRYPEQFDNSQAPKLSGIARVDRSHAERLALWESEVFPDRAAFSQVLRECDNAPAAARPAVNAPRATPEPARVAPVVAGLLPQIGARVDTVSPGFAQSLGLRQAAGALVVEAEAGGPAQKAGLQALDVITEITGQQVQSPADLQESLSRMRPGFKAQLRVWRNKAMRDVVVEIGSAPAIATAPLNATLAVPASEPPADQALLSKARAGDLPSILQLAQQLELAPIHRPEASAWYQKAADAGSPRGMGGLGASYFNAVGPGQNEVLAEQWWRKGAAAGDGRSMSGLSLLYADGKGGLPKNLLLAQEWLSKAVATGDGRALFNMGHQYANGGMGFARDNAQSFAWVQKAAATGEPAIMSNLAEMYENGRAGAAQNDLLALSWAQKAAALGEPRAMNRVGFFHSNGRAGLPQSAAQALTWYQKAAALGDEFGMSNLATYYLTGLVVPQNDALALAWYRKAAAAGNKNAEAQVLLLQARGVR
jgi:TPR repeat protein